MGAGDRARGHSLGGRCRLHHLPGLRPGQVRGRLRLYQGARLPPIVAVRAGSGEILHARMRKGSANTARGPSVLSKSLLPGRGEQGRAARSSCALTRLLVQCHHRRPGTPGRALHHGRALWEQRHCRRHSRHRRGVVGAHRLHPRRHRPGSRADYNGRRLVVRRTRLVDVAQQALFPGWRHHGFLSDLGGSTVELDRFHRQHAPWSSPSATSKRAPAWLIAHRVTSPPMAPGWPAPCSPTTCAAGPPWWARSPRRPAHRGRHAALTAHRRAWPLGQPGRHTHNCVGRCTGPGSTASTEPWRRSGRYRRRSGLSRPAAWRPAFAHQTLTTSHHPKPLVTHASLPCHDGPITPWHGRKSKNPQGGSGGVSRLRNSELSRGSEDVNLGAGRDGS